MSAKFWCPGPSEHQTNLCPIELARGTSKSKCEKSMRPSRNPKAFSHLVGAHSIHSRRPRLQTELHRRLGRCRGPSFCRSPIYAAGQHFQILLPRFPWSSSSHELPIPLLNLCIIDESLQTAPSSFQFLEFWVMHDFSQLTRDLLVDLFNALIHRSHRCSAELKVLCGNFANQGFPPIVELVSLCCGHITSNLITTLLCGRQTSR